MNEKPKIDMREVKSSQVHSVGYHPETKTLAVRFSNGSTYHYANVAPEVHASMLKAESLGKFLSARIKGRHRHTRVDKGKA